LAFSHHAAEEERGLAGQEWLLSTRGYLQGFVMRLAWQGLKPIFSYKAFAARLKRLRKKARFTADWAEVHPSGAKAQLISLAFYWHG